VRRTHERNAPVQAVRVFSSLPGRPVVRVVASSRPARRCRSLGRHTGANAPELYSVGSSIYR